MDINSGWLFKFLNRRIPGVHKFVIASWKLATCIETQRFQPYGIMSRWHLVPGTTRAKKWLRLVPSSMSRFWLKIAVGGFLQKLGYDRCVVFRFLERLSWRWMWRYQWTDGTTWSREMFSQDNLKYSTYNLHSIIHHSIKLFNHFKPEFQSNEIGLDNGYELHTFVVEVV